MVHRESLCFLTILLPTHLPNNSANQRWLMIEVPFSRKPLWESHSNLVVPLFCGIHMSARCFALLVGNGHVLAEIPFGRLGFFAAIGKNADLNSIKENKIRPLTMDAHLRVDWFGMVSLKLGCDRIMVSIGAGNANCGVDWFRGWSGVVSTGFGGGARSGFDCLFWRAEWFRLFFFARGVVSTGFFGARSGVDCLFVRAGWFRLLSRARGVVSTGFRARGLVSIGSGGAPVGLEWFRMVYARPPTPRLWCQLVWHIFAGAARASSNKYAGKHRCSTQSVRRPGRCRPQKRIFGAQVGESHNLSLEIGGQGKWRHWATRLHWPEVCTDPRVLADC